MDFFCKIFPLSRQVSRNEKRANTKKKEEEDKEENVMDSLDQEENTSGEVIGQ